MKKRTFEQIAADDINTIYVDEIIDGVRFIIRRAALCLCAYVGIPKDNPLAGHPSGINCHGGVTFSGPGSKASFLDDDLYWYGWDYAHYGDAVLSPSGIINDIGNGGQPWGTDDVYKNSMPAVREFAKLVAKTHENR